MNLGFLTLAIALTLLAVALVAWPLLRTRGEQGAPVAALGAALAIPIIALLAFLLVSSYPWGAPPPDPALAAIDDTPDLAALRAAARAAPADVAPWLDLGNGLLAAERFTAAALAFRRAHALDRKNDAALLSYAEAVILGDRNQLAGEAGRQVETVLVREPANAKALWYGGMVALGRGDTTAATDRWTRLLDLSPPPAVRSIIEQQLVRMAQSAPDAVAPPPAANAIVLQLSLAPELAGQVREGAVLFVFAREPGSQGPPLAVVRGSAADWPQVVSISDADSMIPGRSLQGLTEIAITARIANDGEALPSPGDPFGEVIWRPGAASPLQLLIDKNVP